ncbi:MAG TPA: hypothetical protein VIZ58_11710 [Thermoanaerobaculia bacterium]
MSFIAYLVAGLSIAASPAHADGTRFQIAPASVERSVAAQAETKDPDRQAKAQSHFDPSHKESTEYREGRKPRAQGKKAQGKRRAAAKQKTQTAGEPK